MLQHHELVNEGFDTFFTGFLDFPRPNGLTGAFNHGEVTMEVPRACDVDPHAKKLYEHRDGLNGSLTNRQRRERACLDIERKHRLREEMFRRDGDIAYE